MGTQSTLTKSTLAKQCPALKTIPMLRWNRVNSTQSRPSDQREKATSDKTETAPTS